MPSLKAWGEFFARVSEKYPSGVRDTLLTEWRWASSEADSLMPPPPSYPSTNRGTRAA